jgi:hypothetical protein
MAVITNAFFSQIRSSSGERNVKLDAEFYFCVGTIAGCGPGTMLGTLISDRYRIEIEPCGGGAGVVFFVDDCRKPTRLRAVLV